MTQDFMARTADHLAILDLQNRYSDAITRSDWDQHEAVFAPDAVWEVLAPINVRFQGARTIRESTSQMMGHMLFCIQTNHAQVVRFVDSDRATATSTMHEFMRSKDGSQNLSMYGIYHDEIARLGGRWLFTSRKFQPVYMDTSPIAGSFVPPAW